MRGQEYVGYVMFCVSLMPDSEATTRSLVLATSMCFSCPLRGHSPTYNFVLTLSPFSKEE